MSAASRSAAFFLCALCFSTTLSAQDETRVALQKSSPAITAAAADGKFRFSSPASVARIRVQIVSASGDTLFDSAWRDGNVLDWPIESPGQPLANGLYRCVVMVSDLDGPVTQKEATFAAHDGQVSIEPRAGTEGLTIIGAGENGPKITMLAHDEKNGAIVNTSGDLIFRFGKFFAGKDSERMRLTADGNLGIGTDKPQAPLDVNGLIRTSKGIMFSDGTILTTAGGQGATGTIGVNRVNPNTQATAIGASTLGQPFASASRLSPRAAAGPAYQFVVDGAGVHIGTTSAFGLDVAGNVSLASNLALPATTPSTGIITLGGIPFAHNFGTSNTFLGSAGNLTMSGSENMASGKGTLVANTTGSRNTAAGVVALATNNTGDTNTAIGYAALNNNSSGAGNIAIGNGAGLNLTTGNSNIDIGHFGVAGEANTIRIGGAAQSRAFISGITGVTTALTGAPLLIDASGQLGTNGGNLGNFSAGTITLAGNLALPTTSSASAGVITLGGSRFAHNFGTNNTFLGANAGNFTMSGVGSDTAIGSNALQANTTGRGNTASGDHVLFSNTTGSFNTASGSNALFSNIGGDSNTAIGSNALYTNYGNAPSNSSSNTAIGVDALLSNTTGSDNTASGFETLLYNTTGSRNTASGEAALLSNTTGTDNIAVGNNAGGSLTTGNFNIDIGNRGVDTEGSTIRIGTNGTQTRTFIAGINSVPVGFGVPVLVNPNGQLGIAPSSRRYKFDINDMGKATESLMRLRPVTFRYLSYGDNAPLQYGLIAEEVDEVYPELVARNKNGEVETVMYQFLAPMLLNEVQKQHRQIEEQQRTIDTLNTTREKQQKTIDALGQRLEALESQVARGK